jgi:hypothetical protein
MKNLFHFLSLSIILSISCNRPSIKENLSKTTEASPLPVLKKYFLKRPNYKLEYYANWKIDSTDQDFNMDSYITFNGPSEISYLSMLLFNTQINQEENIDGQVTEYLKSAIINGKVKYINTWGKYKGYGATINGKFLGVYRGEMKLFAHSCDSCSFMTTSQIFDVDKPMDEEGLKLIESSFQIIK